MTIKQQINHGDIQWHFLCRKPVSRFVNFTLSPPMCYSLKITNYEMRAKTIFGIYGCFIESGYIKGDRKLHL